MTQTTVAPPLQAARDNAIADLDYRLENGMIPENNYEFLRHLIEKADDETEVRNIVAMGTYYKRTGLHYDSKLETQNDRRIRYLKKNDELSFDNGGKQHQLIIGDNYPALQNLLVSHRGKIDVIYIDPPYGCNDMNEAAKTNYTNNLSRDVLLSQLHPRLLLAKDLLTDDGVIFCSIDDKNQAYLKCLMDEVFGERNFIACIDIYGPSVKNNSSFMSIGHEYLLCYAKDVEQTPTKWLVKKNNADDYSKIARSLYKQGLSQEEIHDELLALSHYPKYYDFDHFTYADETGVFQPVTLTAPGSKLFYDIIHPKTGKPCKTENRGWAHSPEEIDRMIQEGLIYFGSDETTVPRKKNYLDDYLYTIAKAEYFVDPQSSTKWLAAHNLTFDFPKPVELIKWILSMYPRKSITILDFYAGSGTTGHAVMEANVEDDGDRRFILVTNNEADENNTHGIAYDVTVPRIKIASAEVDKGDSLAVYDVVDEGVLANTTDIENSPFNLIDETCYGLEPFENIQDKIKWVCENLEGTCSFLTSKEGE